MKFKKGNLLDAPEMLIAHGCNAQGVMGSGVAKYVKEKWPEAYKEYHEICEEYEGHREDLLGSNHYFSVSSDDNEQVLVNAITQVTFGEGKQARYTAIVDCLVAAIEDYIYVPNEGETLQIAIPLIGCGLGGLKWEILKELLEEVEERYDAEFVVYEL